MKSFVFFVLCGIMLPSLVQAQSLADRFDELEREEATGLIEKAKRCADLNDFVCSERNLSAAKNMAISEADRARIVQASSYTNAKRDDIEARANEDDESHDRRLRASVSRSQKKKIAAQRQALREERETQQARRAEYARTTASSVDIESEAPSSFFTLTAVDEVERPPAKNTPFIRHDPPVGKIVVVPVIDPKTVGSRRTPTRAAQTTSR